MTGAGTSSEGFTGLPRPLREIADPPHPTASANGAEGSAPVGLVHVPRTPVAPSADGPDRVRALVAGLARPSRIVPLVAAALALAVGAVVVGGQGDPGPAPGEAIVQVDGLAIVTRADGGTEQVRERTRLEPGDRLRVARGSAALELNDDVELAALAATDDVAATELEMGRTPRLLAGSLLVVAPDDTRVAAGVGRVDLEGGSAARLTRTLASRVDVYRGRAELDSAGATQGVPALRSAEVVAEGDLTGTRPLAYAAGHPWDRRFLGPALALDRELRPLAVGMEASGLDGAALAARLRERLADAPSASELADLLADREAPLDGAIGLAVVGSGTEGTFAARWADGFRFHDAGAPWGLVAMDLATDPEAVIDALRAAIDRTPTDRADLELAGAPTGTDAPAVEAGEAPAGSGTGATGDAGAGSGAGGTGVDGAGGSGPGTTAPGATSPVPPGPGVTVPGVTVPGVTLPPVTLPVEVVVPPLPVVTTIVGTLGTALAPVTGPLLCTGGLLGPVTGSSGLLGGVTGSSGALPLCP